MPLSFFERLYNADDAAVDALTRTRNIPDVYDRIISDVTLLLQSSEDYNTGVNIDPAHKRHEETASTASGYISTPASAAAPATAIAARGGGSGGGILIIPAANAVKVHGYAATLLADSDAGRAMRTSVIEASLSHHDRHGSPPGVTSFAFSSTSPTNVAPDLFLAAGGAYPRAKSIIEREWHSTSGATNAVCGFILSNDDKPSNQQNFCNLFTVTITSEERSRKIGAIQVAVLKVLNASTSTYTQVEHVTPIGDALAFGALTSSNTVVMHAFTKTIRANSSEGRPWTEMLPATATRRRGLSAMPESDRQGILRAFNLHDGTALNMKQLLEMHPDTLAEKLTSILSMETPQLSAMCILLAHVTFSKKATDTRKPPAESKPAAADTPTAPAGGAGSSGLAKDKSKLNKKPYTDTLPADFKKMLDDHKVSDTVIKMAANTAENVRSDADEKVIIKAVAPYAAAVKTRDSEGNAPDFPLVALKLFGLKTLMKSLPKSTAAPTTAPSSADGGSASAAAGAGTSTTASKTAWARK